MHTIHRYLLLLLAQVFFFATASASSPIIVLSQRPATVDSLLTASPSLVFELNIFSLLPITGNVSLSGGAGVHLPSTNLDVMLLGTLPGDLSELSNRSLFRNGENLSVRWNGEIQLLARYFFITKKSGWYASLGLGYESFEIRAKDTDVPANTEPNGFFSAGGGYAFELFQERLYAQVGIGAVLLFGNGGDKQTGNVTYSYNWGFVIPTLRLMLRL